jgi:hypothetical protein
MHRLLLPYRVKEEGTEPLEHDILAQVEEHDGVTLDALIDQMPDYSWNQIFHVVDQLARQRKIVLRRHRFDYTLFSTSYAA